MEASMHTMIISKAQECSTVIHNVTYKTCLMFLIVQFTSLCIVYYLVQHTDFLQNTTVAAKTPNISVDSTYDFIESTSTIEQILSWNERKVPGNSCQILFDYNLNEVVPAKYVKQTLPNISNMNYRKMTKNCTIFKRTRGYLDSPITEIEHDFPIAYSVLAYKDVQQIERLLRAIYRPQNHYCIHMDSKTSDVDMDTVKSISACFDNVFVSEQRINVTWGTFSVLEAELVCIRELFAKKDWKYFINLTGQEFLLKTNLEIVKILTAMKGANIVDATSIRPYSWRWQENGDPPHNIRPTKGSVHIAVNRDFVQFALYDSRCQDFLQYLKNTTIPDETYFSSLNHNAHLNILGTFLGDPEEYPKKPTFTRYKNWQLGNGVWVRKCAGKYVRWICILGVGDLDRLKDDIALFANKFYIDYQPLAYACLEELIYNRTRDQYIQQSPIDVTYYAHLDQVHKQVKKHTLS